MFLRSRITQLTITATLLITLSLSCSKEKSQSLSPQEEEQAATISGESDSEAEIIYNGIFDDVMGVNDDVGLAGTGIFGRYGFSPAGRADSVNQCFTVTVNRLSANDPFPVRIIIDFGNAGCTGRDGHTRYGKIVIEYTGRLIVPGNSASVVFQDFRIDELGVGGSLAITNTGSTGNRQFTVEVEGKLTRPNGNYTQWNSRRVITQIEGLSTPLIALDDIFQIEGSASAKIKRGDVIVACESHIVEPLIKRYNCRWLVKGIVEAARENLSSTSKWVARLNYGDGGCDNLAVLTINGVEHQITLH